MKRMQISAIVVGLVASTAVARAQGPKAQADAAAAEAEARFQRAEYGAAAEAFKLAYSRDPDPAYLFDIAQAYRLGGDCANAADYYAKLLERVPDPPSLDKINTWLAQQRACAQQRTAPPPAVVSAPPLAPITDHTGHTDQTDQTDDMDHGRTMRGIAIGAAIVGGSALALGGYFTWDAHQLHDHVDALCTTLTPCTQSELDDYDHRGSRANSLAITGYIVGGAAIAGSVALFVLAHNRAEPPVAIVPTAGGAVVVGTLRF